MARVVSTRHIPSMYRSNDLYNWCPIELDEISSEPIQEIKIHAGPMECVRPRLLNVETAQHERKLALNRERVRRYRAKQKKLKKSS